MPQYEFGEGQEMLAQAFQHIVALQQGLFQLKQRTEIDALMIAVLLNQVALPAEALEQWTSMVGQYYPAQAVEHLKNDLLVHSQEELTDRIAFWTQVLQKNAGQ